MGYYTDNHNCSAIMRSHRNNANYTKKMQLPQNIILSFLVCILFLVALTSCSPSPGSLVGEWQSSKPESVNLKITQGASYGSDGFHAGFSFTRDGRTQNHLWLIKNETSGTILYLAAGAGAGGWLQSGRGLMLMNAVPYKVIELTSDRLVVEWDNARTTPRGTYEFHRVKNRGVTF